MHAVAVLVDAAKPPADHRSDSRRRPDLRRWRPGASDGHPTRYATRNRRHLRTAAARSRAERLRKQATRLVVVEAVDNPINVGSIVRNAVALGWDGMIFDYTSADPLSRRSLRVVDGPGDQLSGSARCTDLPAELRRLAADGFTVCALTPSPDAETSARLQSPRRWPSSSGRNGQVCRPNRSPRSTHRHRIPMADGVDSLNAAAASADACYALGRLHPRR